MLLLKRKTAEYTLSGYSPMNFSNPDFTYFALFTDKEPGIQAFMQSFEKPLLLMSVNTEGKTTQKLIKDYFKDTKDTVFVTPLLSVASAFTLPSAMMEYPQQGRTTERKRSALHKNIYVTDIYVYRKGSIHDAELPLRVFNLSEYLTKHTYKIIDGDMLQYVVAYEEFCRHLYQSKVTVVHEHLVRTRRHRK